jgi:hypothetical protein
MAGFHFHIVSSTIAWPPLLVASLIRRYAATLATPIIIAGLLFAVFLFDDYAGFSVRPLPLPPIRCCLRYAVITPLRR